MRSKRCLVVIICILLTACSGMEIRNQVDKLNRTLIDYGADLRWGRINMAYAYHVDKEGKQIPYDLDRMENFSVTDFRPVNPVINEDGSEATVPVEIDYYDERSGTLQKLKYVQHWWYREESKRWFVDSDFPDFK